VSEIGAKEIAKIPTSVCSSV